MYISLQITSCSANFFRPIFPTWSNAEDPLLLLVKYELEARDNLLTYLLLALNWLKFEKSHNYIRVFQLEFHF